MKWDLVTFEVPGLGKVAYPCPVIEDDWPDDLKEALTRRRIATVEGTCVCGAVATYPSRAERRAAMQEGVALHSSVGHEDGCTADDDSIKRILREHGMLGL